MGCSRKTAMSSVVDLTHPIEAHTLPYPGDPAPALRAVASVTSDGFALTQVTLTTHTGTHMDAAAHVIEGGRALREYPPEDFMGRACVLDVRALTEPITEEALVGVGPCDWLLVLTGQSGLWGTLAYFAETPLFDASFVRAAAGIARKGLGLDCPGLDRDGVALHRTWFEAGGGLIVENLTGLEQLIGAASIAFTALPLRLAAADGAPVRAMARLA